MNRRRWIFVPLTVAVLVLGLTAGAVLAYGNGNGDGALGSFVSRVASILGLDEAQVQDAFDQAARDIQDDRLQQRLDRLVESGHLTQEQADEYREWMDSRPEGIYPGFRFRGHGIFGGGFLPEATFPEFGLRGHGIFGGGFWLGREFHERWFFEAPSPEPTPEGTSL